MVLWKSYLMFETYCFKLSFLYSNFSLFQSVLSSSVCTITCYSNRHNKSVRPELVYWCQIWTLSTICNGSYEPIWDIAWGVLTVSDMELQEMSPRNDPVSFMPLHDCIHTLYFFFFFQKSILLNFLTSLCRFWAL